MAFLALGAGLLVGLGVILLLVVGPEEEKAASTAPSEADSGVSGVASKGGGASPPPTATPADAGAKAEPSADAGEAEEAPPEEGSQEEEPGGEDDRDRAPERPRLTKEAVEDLLKEARSATARLEWGRARRLYRRVASGRYKRRAGYLGLARVAFEQKRYGQAIRHARKAGASIPALELLGNAYFAQGEYRRALRHYERILKRRPGHASARRAAAAARERLGGDDGDGDAKTGGPSAAELIKEAQGAAKASQFGKALRLCQRALKKAPGNQEATFVCAIVSCNLKSKAGARRYIRQIRSPGKKSMARQICLRNGIPFD